MTVQQLIVAKKKVAKLDSELLKLQGELNLYTIVKGKVVKKKK